MSVKPAPQANAVASSSSSRPLAATGSNDSQPPPRLPWYLSFWLSLRALGRVLWLARWSVAPLLIGGYALLLNDQAQEVLREFAARDGWWGDVWEFAVFALIYVIWAWNTWLCARLLTELYLPETPAFFPHELFYRIWVPRALGALAALVVPAAILLASRSYVGHSPTSVTQMVIIAAGLLVIGVVFIAWTVFRSHLKWRWLGGARDTHILARGKQRFRELLWFDRYAFLGTAILTVGTFFYFWQGDPLPSPVIEFRMLVFGVIPVGAAAILLAALAAWIPFGSALVYASALTYRVPYFALLILLALVSSLTNDNHVVRTLDQSDAKLVAAAPSMKMPTRGNDCEIATPPDANPSQGAGYPMCGYVRRWLEARRSDILAKTQPGVGDQNSRATPYEVYIVAAAGGGIRAAYWTAGMLAFRQDLHPDFGAHLLAISGVSGGSLGAAVFAGLLKAQRDAVAQGREARNCRGTFEKQPLTSCAVAVLSGDFLAPTLGVMLYPDLVQRFVPFPVPYTDRARALERGWESRWRAAMADDWMESSYDALADPDPAAGLPLLLLNSTDVEDGKRALVSPLPVAPLEFPDTVDVRKLVGRPMRVSTAAHLSARFTYVSPAATVRVRTGDGNERTWGHLVDGGYFENSGAATALDVLAALQRAAAQAGLADRIVPVVLLLSNNPDAPKPAEDPTQSPPHPLRFAVETRAPLETMLETREGRGTQAQAVLKRAVEWPAGSTLPGRFELYQPRKDIVPLPLGWMLSPSARRALDTQIIQQSLVRDNAASP